MKKRKPIRLLALALAGLALALFVLYQTGLIGGQTDAPATLAAAPAAAAPAASIPVKAMRIQNRELTDFISVSGSTAAAEEVLISSEVPGKVKTILFREGDLVQKNAPIVRLDDDELQAQRNRLQVQANLNQKIAERLLGLYEKEGVSLQDYEIAAAEFEKAKAELTLLDAQLEKRIIRAPFTGRLGLRLVSEGAYLAPGTPIVKLVSVDPIKLNFSIPEKYSSSVGRGTRVSFQIEGMTTATSATVEAGDPVIDPATRTVLLKATAPNPGGKILPGAFASVRVNLENFGQTIMIPTEALTPELGGAKVFVYRSGLAQSVNVSTGIRLESRIQVLAGLQAGDTLLTSGLLQVKNGAPVHITELE